MRIVFMGTPEFAVASLDALKKAGFNIVGVVTAPDKQAGRGMQLQQSAVKKYALEQDLKILQPEKLKNPDFLEELKNLHADLQVVVAFQNVAGSGLEYANKGNN
jgi:methionyl-tRNA formyltransferase